MREKFHLYLSVYTYIYILNPIYFFTTSAMYKSKLIEEMYYFRENLYSDPFKIPQNIFVDQYKE